MQEQQILERLVAVEERSKSNTKRLNEAEAKINENERVLNNVDKSLSVTVEQIKNIAEDLKQTSINFKEAMMRSNAANSKETEVLKEKYNALEKKFEKLDSKLEQETVIKDAESWRSSKKQILAWRNICCIRNNSSSIRNIKIFIRRKNYGNTNNNKYYNSCYISYSIYNLVGMANKKERSKTICYRNDS